MQFVFRELHQVCSRDGGSTIAGGFPNPGSTVHPHMLRQAVAHCRGIKLDSLMSSELLVRTSSSSNNHFIGSCCSGPFGFLIFFVFREKSRPVVPHRNKHSSRHAVLNQMELFMEVLQSRACSWTAAVLLPAEVRKRELWAAWKFAARVWYHARLAVLGERHDTENVLITTGRSTAFCRGIPPSETPNENHLLASL